MTSEYFDPLHFNNHYQLGETQFEVNFGVNNFNINDLKVPALKYDSHTYLNSLHKNTPGTFTESFRGDFDNDGDEERFTYTYQFDPLNNGVYVGDRRFDVPMHLSSLKIDDKENYIPFVLNINFDNNTLLGEIKYSMPKGDEIVDVKESSNISSYLPLY